MFVIYVFLAVLVGFGFATQAAITSKISVVLTSPINAVFVSLSIGVMALLCYKILTGNIVITGVRVVPAWLYISGGMLGVFSLTILIFITSKIGVSLSIGIMVAAQLILALLLDHFGAFGLEVRPINLYKILGVMFLLLGMSFCLYFR